MRHTYLTLNCVYFHNWLCTRRFQIHAAKADDADALKFCLNLRYNLPLSQYFHVPASVPCQALETLRTFHLQLLRRSMYLEFKRYLEIELGNDYLSKLRLCREASKH